MATVATIAACLGAGGAQPAGATATNLPVTVLAAQGGGAFTFGQGLAGCPTAFGIGDTTSEQLDMGGVFRVGGAFFADADGVVDVTGPVVRPDAATMAGLVVQPEWRVVDDHLARLVISFTNPSTAPVSTDVDYETNVSSDADTQVRQTEPDGDTSLDGDDDMVWTSDLGGFGSDLFNVTAWGNDFARGPASISGTTSFACNGTQGVAVRYPITVPPGETRRLMFFQGRGFFTADTLALMQDIEDSWFSQGEVLGNLDGVTRDAAMTIVNWGIRDLIQGGGSQWTHDPGSVTPGASEVCTPGAAPHVFEITEANRNGQFGGFLSGAMVTVAGEYVSGEPGSLTHVGEALRAPTQAHGGLATTVEYRATSTGMRLLVSLTNGAASAVTQPVTVESNMASQTDTRVAGSSSGDTTIGADDRWFTLNDADVGGDAALTSVVAGPGNPTARPGAPTLCGTGGAPAERHADNFSVMVPPFSTRYLMAFFALAADDAGANAAGAVFDANPAPGSEVLDGLTPAHLARILNWDLAPPTVTGVSPPTLGRGETTDVVISGTGLLGDSTVSFGPGVTVNAINPVSDTQLIANVTTSTATSTGTRAVTVSRAGGSSGSCPGCVQVVRSAQGYWMLEADGDVYPFGGAVDHGDANTQVGATGTGTAVDIEPTPSGNGYWVLDSTGNVHPFGDAADHGDLGNTNLAPGERASAISATIDGAGYWIFTNRGRAVTFGNAVAHGGMENVPLNGPVLDSIITASGNGYYMVASDGGIFSFGDAQFRGSMGAAILNAPVQSLVPDADGVGYWLVASDGGIFAFDADFRGSMGATPLAKPVTGMIRFGNGYLMVAEDGGIFNFSDRPFYGSLGANPPPNPITSVAAYAP